MPPPMLSERQETVALGTEEDDDEDARGKSIMRACLSAAAKSNKQSWL